MQLQGKVCLVTGAAGVLCSQLVRALAREGARVALMGRTASKLAALRDELAAAGYQEVLVCPADVQDRSALEAARAEINQAFGPVDILINGAGGNHPDGTAKAERMRSDTPLEESFFGCDVAGFRSVFELNFLGTLLPCQVFGEDMLAGGGCVLNVSSMSALLPLTKVGAYSAAKAAVDNFTRWLAVHLAPRGIRVNALAPGFFLTEQNRFLLTTEEGSLTPRGETIVSQTPLGRFGDPEDLESALLFLVSDASRFVTGVVLPVDGGFSAFSGV